MTHPGYSRLPHLAAGVVFAFEMLPIIVVIVASFGTASYVQVPPHGFTLEWYRMLFQKGTFLRPFLWSLALAGLAVPISLVLAAPTGYVLARFRFRLRRLLDVVTLAPVIIPEIVLAIALLQLAATFDLRQSFGLAVIGHTVLVFPFVLRTTLASLASFDPAVEEAAIGLGASRLTAFWRVVVPYARPGLVAGAILGVLVSFDAFFMSMFLAGRETLPIAIFNALRFDFNPTILALSTLMIVVIGPLIVFVERVVGLEVLVGAGRA